MSKPILVILLACLTACAGTEGGTAASDSAVSPVPTVPGVPVTPPSGAYLSASGPATIVIKNVVVGQIRRLAAGDGVAAIGSADLTITCTITGPDLVECTDIPGVPR